MRSLLECKKELIEHYTDQDGQITIDRDPSKWSTGNGLMHLGLIMTFYEDFNILNELDKNKFKIAVQACENSPGVYDRNPGRDDQSAHDDITGIVSGSVATGLSFHYDVVNHGLKNFFIYNNDGKLEVRDFLGRQIWHVMFWLLSTKNSLFLPLLPVLLAKLILVRSKSYSILHTFMMLSTLARLYPRVAKLCNKKIATIGLSQESERYFKLGHPAVDLSVRREQL